MRNQLRWHKRGWHPHFESGGDLVCLNRIKYIVEIVLIVFCCRLQRRQFLLVWTIRNQGFQQERSRWHFPVSSKKETTITSAERTSSSTLEVNTWCNWTSFAFFIKNNQTNYSKPMRTVWKNSNRELWSGENHWLRTTAGRTKTACSDKGDFLAGRHDRWKNTGG